MRDRHIREGLADDADAPAARFFDGRRLEYPAGGSIKGGRIVEGSVLGEEDILRQELTPKSLEVPPQICFPVGEFPMDGHGVDAEEICGLDHVGAGERLRQAAALAGVAAVEAERISRTAVRAQTIDQGLEMGKAAHAAVTLRGLLIIEEGEGVGAAAPGRDPEVVEEGAADEVRRTAGHRPDADVDARLAVMNRRELRMGVGDMQNADVAEAADVVNVVVGSDPDPRHDTGADGRDESTQEPTAGHGQVSAIRYQGSGMIARRSGDLNP